MQITSFSCVVKNKGSGEVQEIESVRAWNTCIIFVSFWTRAFFQCFVIFHFHDFYWFLLFIWFVLISEIFWDMAGHQNSLPCLASGPHPLDVSPPSRCGRSAPKCRLLRNWNPKFPKSRLPVIEERSCILMRTFMRIPMNKYWWFMIDSWFSPWCKDSSVFGYHWHGDF